MGEQDFPPVEDFLNAAGSLPPDANLDAVQAWLEGLREGLNGAPSNYWALVHQGARNRLEQVDAVSRPAALADQFLATKGRKSDDDLQGRGVDLENPEPWPEPVEGGVLLRELEAYFQRFLALPEGASVALPLWVVFSHAHDAFVISPVLAITSPVKRCGKTTLLELLSAVVPKPLPAANITSAGVFRAVDQFDPTLLVDEADTFVHDGSELRGILNSGHRRSMAKVVRNVAAGDDYEPRIFNTWAPKAVALIGELPGTLQDRSVEIRMRRRMEDEEVERLRLDRLGEFEDLRRKAWTWAQENLTGLQQADPGVPGGLHDRACDNWRSLLAVADLAGGEWPEKARNAARVLSGQRFEGEQSEALQLLRDVYEVFRNQGEEQLPTSDLLRELNAREESPWPEKRGGLGLSPNGLASLLRPFEVSSTALWVGHGDAGRMLRGFKREQFRDAWKRYLPAAHPPAEVQGVQGDLYTGGPGASGSRKADERLAPAQEAESASYTGDLAGLSGDEGRVEAEGGAEDEPYGRPDGDAEVFSGELS